MAHVRVGNNVDVRDERARFMGRLSDGINDACQEMALVGTAAAKAAAPVDRGILKARTSAEVGGGGAGGSTTVHFVSRVKYASHVTDGTVPHQIGTPGQRLSNRQLGAFGRKAKGHGFGAIGPVNHPGTRPNPFLKAAWQATFPKSLYLIKKHV